MKLLNEFFTIESAITNPGELVYCMHLNKEHYIYKAHFPNNPITPGVCILQIAQELIGKYLKVNLELQTLNNVKYMSIISPISNSTISLYITYIIFNETVKAKGIIKDDNVTFTKFSATYIKR